MGLVNFPPPGHTVTPGMDLCVNVCVCLNVCSSGLCVLSELGEIILKGEVGAPKD